MRTRTPLVLPARLSRARRHFERWRSTRKPPSRIPEDLWSLAVELSQEYGLARTARTLSLGYNTLKKRLEAVSSTGPSVEASGSGFFELLPPVLPGPAECVVELEDAGGSKMRIHLKGTEIPDVTSLSRSFWRSEA
ncbi:MAG: hypothetical protein H8E90_07790 [Anaerolineales bacterium]|nr:hypothetical protein [Anaerolineales bacterium]